MRSERSQRLLAPTGAHPGWLRRSAHSRGPLAEPGSHSRDARADRARADGARARTPLYALLTLCALLAHLALAAGCSAERRFPRAPVMWDDPDRAPFAPKPQEYVSPFAWDAADQTVFRPFARMWLFEPSRRAINVNALDEVPSSSWFTHRAGYRALSADEWALGACHGLEPLSPDGPWTVVDAKPDGFNPGFVMEASDGRRYVVKFDGLEQPERATAADVVGSRIYWAAGYHVPCNQIVFFEPEILELAPDATAEREDGTETPLEWADIELTLSKAHQLADGRYRASVSLYLDGEPIGPWTYQGVRDDDPNDVVPHEHRRDVRGMYVLAAWTNHFDSREQNTLAMFVRDGDVDDARGWVRHNMIDFGDCFGSLWEWDGISRRLGHANYLDLQNVLVDFLTLGFIVRPWDVARWGASGRVFGYYGVERFVPDEWDPGYPNPAFSELTEADAAWMARILADFDDEAVRAMVGAARFEHADLGAELERILVARRDKTLRRWLVESPLSPLGGFEVRYSPTGRARLCAQDRAVVGGVVLASTRSYGASARGDDGVELSIEAPTVIDETELCVTLPEQDVDDAPLYLTVDLEVSSPGVTEHGPLRAHLYQTSPLSWELVGVERFMDADAADAAR